MKTRPAFRQVVFVAAMAVPVQQISPVVVLQVVILSAPFAARLIAAIAPLEILAAMLIHVADT